MLDYTTSFTLSSEPTHVQCWEELHGMPDMCEDGSFHC